MLELKMQMHANADFGEVQTPTAAAPRTSASGALELRRETTIGKRMLVAFCVTGVLLLFGCTYPSELLNSKTSHNWHGLAG